MTSPIDIRPDHLEIVQGILREHLPVDVKVWVFGSRTNWTTKDSSDLDIALDGENKLSHKVLGALKDAFEDSTLPYTVDVVDLHAVSHDFKKIVEEQRVALPSVRASERVGSAWREVVLGDVCTKIGSGATPRGGRDVYLEEGPYTLIRSQNVYNDGFHRDGLASIGERHADELKNVEVFQDDVLLNITGDSVARVCQVAPDVLPARVNQHVAIIRPDSVNLDTDYLRYCLVTPEMQTLLLSWAGSGGTRNALTKGMIESLEIPLPVLLEQRAIAHVLGTLDDKIELNRRMNATLEGMARAIFHDWFVDFGPTRAKIEGREPYLPPQLWSLFPDRLAPSDLGDIPEGWEVRALGDEIAELVTGSRPRGGAAEFGIPSIGAENINGLGSHDYSKEKFIPESHYTALVKRGANVHDGDVLLYKDGAYIGRKAYADCSYPHEECAINEHVFIVRLKNKAAQRYLFFWLDQEWMTSSIVDLNSTSAQPGINQVGVRSLPLMVPSSEALGAFDWLTCKLTSKLFGNCHESRTLAAQRDALLPGLVSGAVGVEE